jgi:hypothetical protein
MHGQQNMKLHSASADNTSIPGLFNSYLRGSGRPITDKQTRTAPTDMRTPRNRKTLLTTPLILSGEYDHYQ